jgi:phosphoesterase RecJ-like protein
MRIEADNLLLSTIREEIAAAERILLVSHIRPDGDAIGSLVGLGSSLIAAGKQVQMVLSDGVPANFRFLTGSELVKKRATGDFDYRIVVDASELARVGPALHGHPKPDLNIDHHVTNEMFGRHNLVLSDAAATAEILARYLPALGLNFPLATANALLLGMVTDTIGFRTRNVTPQVLRVAASLMELGADLANVYYTGLVSRSFAAARFWGCGLNRVHQEDGLVWTSLTLADRTASAYGGRDDADLINVLSAIEGADVALIFVEQSAGHVKISWRVCGQADIDADVSVVAQQFGGGGHRAAAGAEVDGTLDNVQMKILTATRRYLDRIRNERISPPDDNNSLLYREETAYEY